DLSRHASDRTGRFEGSYLRAGNALAWLPHWHSHPDFLLRHVLIGPNIRGMEAAMMLCSPRPGKLLALTAIALLAPSVFAQSQPKYDPATEAKLKGIVEELKLDPPSGGKPVAYLLIKNGENKTQIFLCPKSFLDEMGVTFSPGDDIQVTGSKVKQGGNDLI